MENKNKDIGALWIQTGQYGEYWTGTIDMDGVKQRVIVYKNKYKSKENQPDLRIKKKELKEEKQEEIIINDDSELPF